MSNKVTFGLSNVHYSLASIDTEGYRLILYLKN